MQTIDMLLSKMSKKLQIWRVPPFTDKIFAEKGVTDLRGIPPPLYGKNPQSSILMSSLMLFMALIAHSRVNGALAPIMKLRSQR